MWTCEVRRSSITEDVRFGKVKLLLSLSSLITLTCFFTCGTAPRESSSAEPKQNKDWRLYTPPDKSFSVELPCEPAQKNVSEASTPIYEYACGKEESSGLSFFTVLVLKLSDSDGAWIRDEAAFERSIRNSFSPNKRLIKLIPIKIQGGMGREVIVTNTTDEMDNFRGRVIVHFSCFRLLA
jgi:hypothetical protein